MTNNLDSYLVFQFKFINKTKIVNTDIIDKLKQISSYQIRDLLLNSKQQCGYGTISAKDTKLPLQLPLQLISYIKKNHEIDLKDKIEKYDYLRVGGKERIYGKLFDNIFYALIYDKDKKKQ